MKREVVSIQGLRQWGVNWWIFGGVIAFIIGTIGSTHLAMSDVLADWSTYQSENGHSGFNGAESMINSSTAPHLKLHWTQTAAGSISTQPVEANGLVYWGSWDGYEHATNLNNNQVWTTQLGTTTNNNCYPASVGVSSTATVATVNGRSMLFVGGGNAHMYALDALHGTILWSTSLGSSPDHFIWSSPLVYNGSVYIGLASFGGCPQVQGEMFKLNAATGAVQSTWAAVPPGCIGGGISGSATIDEAEGMLYFGTGSPGRCNTFEAGSPAVIELNASTLALVGSWTLPANQQSSDSDFLSTPTLFTTSGGTQMVGVANKNGKFYAFKRDAISSGPVWSDQVANSGNCPQCDTSSISPAAWDGHTLYDAGGGITINGASCQGSVSAINPNNGDYIWRDCLTDGPVLGAVAMAPGVLVIGQGRFVMVMAASSGQTLFRYFDTNTGSAFWSGASISNGVIYIGNIDGRLYAFGT